MGRSVIRFRGDDLYYVRLPKSVNGATADSLLVPTKDETVCIGRLRVDGTIYRR